MEEDERRPRRKATWIIGALLATVTLTLYPLSIGPALWLHDRGYFSVETFWIAYYPLLWIVDKSPVLNGLLKWYAAFWER
jgi:hypothetical protein